MEKHEPWFHWSFAWLYELFGTAVTVLSPTLHSLGIRYYYYVDAIIMFLVIPFCHLMNDDETKATIVERGWYHGVKFMVGFKDNRIEATGWKQFNSSLQNDNWQTVAKLIYQMNRYNKMYAWITFSRIFIDISSQLSIFVIVCELDFTFCKIFWSSIKYIMISINVLFLISKLTEFFQFFLVYAKKRFC